MKSIIILGTGGTCIDILDTLLDINRALGREEYRCVGFLDDDPKNQGEEYSGVKVLGPLASALEYSDCRFVNGIGSPRNFWKKQDIIRNTGLADNSFETLIHPSAHVSKWAKVGSGSVIFANATVSANTVIGQHVVVLPNSVVSHDCLIGDYVCIAGGVCLSGGVIVGRLSYLGTNASVIDGATLGEFSMVGMGGVVLEDVAESTVVVGNPARFLRVTQSEPV